MYYKKYIDEINNICKIDCNNNDDVNPGLLFLKKFLENLFINGEDVAQKMQLIEPRLKAARNNALTIVNTPDFAEMKKNWELNRKGMYHKYYNMFKSWNDY